MDGPTAGQQIFLVLYAIFWAGIFTTSGRYNAFDTTTAFFANSLETRRLARCRLFVGVMIMNVLPLFSFAYFYKCLVPVISFNRLTFIDIVSIGFIATSVFGWQRILHAFVASDEYWKNFYEKKEWEIVMNNWKSHVYLINESPSDRLKKEQKALNSFTAHLYPGLGYLILAPLLGILLDSFENFFKAFRLLFHIFY